MTEVTVLGAAGMPAESRDKKIRSPRPAATAAACQGGHNTRDWPNIRLLFSPCRAPEGLQSARFGAHTELGNTPVRRARQKEHGHDAEYQEVAVRGGRCLDAWEPAGDLGVRRCGRCRQARDVLEGRRADFSGEMSRVPSAGIDRPDVPYHLPGGAALGALDQGARGDASDAAMAYRPQRRRAEVQERHVAERR